MTKSNLDRLSEADKAALQAALAGRDLSSELDSVEDVLKLIDRVQSVRKDDTDPAITAASTLPTGRLTQEIAISQESAVQAQRIGRFRILRQLGQGGYGLVYLAHDTELDRHVALKIPRPEAIVTDELRARFLREGKAAALLSHPNIVPVFESGYIGSVCYIVSHYVEGVTLADWCRAGRFEPKCAAEIVATLAEAVQHAHSKGVIHRDLKPANILIQQQEGDGRELDPGEPVARQQASDSPLILQPTSLRITDFGLAKTLTDSDSFTGTGAVIGTPAYMSPEQVAGAGPSCGAAADIYSLGAVLYELLTGRPPFVGDSVLQTLRQVQEVDAVPPRRLQSGISPDLDAICLKCLEKQPAERYSSAAALQADLVRYLTGEPVVARPVSPTRRFDKWCRRNPAIAGLSAVLGLLGFSAVIALSSLWLRSERHLALAETKSAQLSNSIQALFEILATSPEIQNPAAEPLRRRVIEQAESVYASLVRETPDDVRMRFDQAKSIGKVAEILDAMGAVRDALHRMDEALEIASTLNGNSIGISQSEYETTMATWFATRGHLQTKLGDFAAAARSLDKGLAHYEQVGDAETDSEAYVNATNVLPGRAHLLARQALTAVQGKDISAALTASQRCEALWRKLVGQKSIGSQTDNLRFQMAHSLLILGQVYDVADNLAKSEQLLAEAIDLVDSIEAATLVSQSGVPAVRAACYHRLGIAVARQGRLDEARRAYHNSVEQFQQLVDDYPDVTEYRERQNSARYSLAFTEYASGNYQLATTLLQENVASFHWLIKRCPDLAGLMWDRVGDNYGVISMIIEADPAGAVQPRIRALHDAVSAYEESLVIRPAWIEPMVGLSRAHTKLGEIFCDQQRDWDAAQFHLTTAIERLQTVAANSDWQDALVTLAAAHHIYAGLLDEQGESELAIEQCQRGLEVVRDSNTKDMVLELARLLAETGRLDEAEHQIRGYIQDLAITPADHEAGLALTAAIAETLATEAGQQRFLQLADELR